MGVDEIAVSQVPKCEGPGAPICSWEAWIAKGIFRFFDSVAAATSLRMTLRK